MKIALYLGSFNPFHNGHLKVVKSALDDFKMDEVIIVPTVHSPWKTSPGLSIDQRASIINYSIRNDEDFKYFKQPNKYNVHSYSKFGDVFKLIEVDLIEESLTPPYYSYATLHALKNKYCNDEIYVLCGEDTIKDIPNWMNGEAIIQDYDFLIVDRPEGDISSSEIRKRLQKHESIKGLVPDEAAELITKYYMYLIYPDL